LIIHLIIQTILLYPSGAIWTDEVPNGSRLDPSRADQIDAEHPSRNRKVVGFESDLGTAGPPCVDTKPDQLIAGGAAMAGHQREMPRPGTLCR
jgi:hypothetical protein